ncbi:hypothetical protein SM0020_33283 [Sinorhizobium meliloti CCNWSX0020]|uniref:Uncharacterized protein n=1 Tax=Sinorhizobium meliloti CCNWSX0020 TaxID=1107881 RepID=H0GAU4_RHIML|nr:hypothetical protein SM0020_33283 [Sinorhizobium meliloti CCNWSX0020]PII38081.1 hypothetical protein T190_26565 [Sinorhizobium meliloti CCBAU 01290]
MMRRFGAIPDYKNARVALLKASLNFANDGCPAI